MPWFMRQCFLDSDVSRTCFPATAYIPPACEASGSKRCPTNTTLPTATPAWIRWTCIEGFNTPVRLALDGQDQVPACMTTDGKAWLVSIRLLVAIPSNAPSCLSIFTQTFEECQVLANTPRPNTVALTCGQKFAEIYGASGYSYNPLTWCTAAYFALDSTAIIAHWPFPPNPTLNYTCLPRIHTPVTIIPETGETACMLAPRTQGNPVGCLWFNSRKACLAAVKTPPADVDVTNPFSCGNWHKKVYGVDGYNDTDPRNWCSAGRKALRPNETNYEGEMTLFPTPTKTILTSVSIPTETLTGGMPGPGGVSYFCIPTVHTPLRISPNGKDVACMSLDGYLCYWLQTTDECQIAAGKGDASTSNLSCVGLSVFPFARTPH